jgi:hypothetical protein
MAVTVTISVLGTQVAMIEDLPYVSGMNVQQVMEAAYAAEMTSPLKAVVEYTLEYYGPSFGYELVTLDSMSLQVGADGESSAFWELLLNGQMTSTGIDSTFPADGDSIEWNYTIYSPDRHSGTRYEALRGSRKN